jgi:DNA polymerase-3 subunit epsilon
MISFLAIDFETADNGRDSACAVGMVRVDNGKIAKRETYLIRPPRRRIEFSSIHGIYWEDVCDKPTFRQLWPRIQSMMYGVDFLVAHNASFDRGVLHGCCEAARIEIPQLEFHCTMKLARQLWNIYPTKLPDVCRHFDIPLNHHEAGSDAEACALIMVEALKEL